MFLAILQLKPSNRSHVRQNHRAGMVWHLAKVAVLLLLAGYLLFAHGCHGDEDSELLNFFPETACRLPSNLLE